MLWQRIMSALIGIPLAIGVSYAGGVWFRIGVGIIILLGYYEYGNMMRNRGCRVPFLAGYLSVLCVIAYALTPGPIPDLISGGVFFLILVFHGLAILLGRISFDEMAFSFIGVFLFAWTLSHLILIRETFPQGFYYILLCFIITWSTDTGAYFFGRFFGRHKLSPVISPNKTVEGGVGGTVFCLLVVFALKTYFTQLSLALLLTLTLFASVAGQIGDLLESAVKRWAGVKDSGNVIPGHGGVLDRFDSLTLVAPLVYYFLKPFILG